MVFPCHSMSRGRPTFTESNRAIVFNSTSREAFQRSLITQHLISCQIKSPISKLTSSSSRKAGTACRACCNQPRPGIDDAEQTLPRACPSIDRADGTLNSLGQGGMDMDGVGDHPARRVRVHQIDVCANELLGAVSPGVGAAQRRLRVTLRHVEVPRLGYFCSSLLCRTLLTTRTRFG